MNKSAVAIAVGAVAIGLGLAYWHANRSTGVAVRVPALSAEAQLGQSMFERSCVTCHGKHASGTKNGPPLIHKVYEPSHHSDQSFHRAVQKGVRAHHWPFGNMPPVGNVKPSEVDLIVRYVRELQKANGID